MAKKDIVWVTKPLPVQAHLVTLASIDTICTAIGAKHASVAYMRGNQILIEWHFPGVDSVTAFVGEYLVRGSDGTFANLDTRTFNSLYEPAQEVEEVPVLTDPVLGSILATILVDDVLTEAHFHLPDDSILVMVPKKTPEPEEESKEEPAKTTPTPHTVSESQKAHRSGDFKKNK